MFNKKRIEQMENRIKALERENTYLRRMLEALSRAHLNEPSYYQYAELDGTVRYYPRFYHAHGTISAPTRECGDVTFKELAQYVIDKEPIAREVTATKYFEHPDNCQGSTEDTNNA